MYYVYILLSQKDERLYVGSTSNIRKRFNEHNKARIEATKYRVPLKLIYFEAFINKTDALLEEKFLKTGKGRKRLKYLFKHSLK